MKIGIIAINMYSKGLNFACPLHTYAFQQFLLEKGFDATVINYKPIYFDNFDLRNPYHYYAIKYKERAAQKPDTAEGIALQKEKLKEFKKKRDSWEPLQAERAVRYDKFESFIQSRYKKTEICYDSDLLEVMDPGFDCYICATDVIWKNQPGNGYDRGFFLASSCMENKWKISYAASRGVYLANSDEEHQTFFHYIKDIDFISVREASLKQYIEEHSDRNAELVLDPVLLHTRDFYDSFSTPPKDQHYIFLYYVMEKAADTITQAVNFARLHKLKIIEVTDLPLKNGRLSKYTDIEHELHLDIGIEEWLGYLSHADYVFTNSFHACCFCILFEKEFFAGFRKGDKVSNILNALGLSERSITAETDLSQVSTERIDYTPVRKLLQKLKFDSESFLLNALKEVQKKQKERKDYTKYKKELTYKILYNSQLRSRLLSWNYDTDIGIMKHLSSGNHEYGLKTERARNDGSSRLLKNGYSLKGCRFIGWNLRIRIDNRWFWCMDDGSLCLKEEYDKKTNPVAIRIFQDEETIPYLPVNRISVMVAEAIWEKNIPVRIKESVLALPYKFKETFTF